MPEFILTIYIGKIIHKVSFGRGDGSMVHTAKEFRSAQKRGLELSRLGAKPRVQALFIFCLLIISLFYLTAATNTADAATYYLDAVNGNDSNPGTSEQPWKTIERAYDRDTSDPNVEPGDTVYLRNGNYGSFVEQEGSRSSWITYKADTGHTPIFTNIELGLWSGPYGKYYKFEDVNVDNPSTDNQTNAVAYLNTVNHIEFKNCSFTGRGYQFQPSRHDEYCIYIRGTSSYITFDNCSFRGTQPAWDEDEQWLIRVDHPCDHTIIKDCNFTYSNSALRAYGTDWAIQGNTITDMTEDGLICDFPYDFNVSDNRIHDLIRDANSEAHVDCIQFQNEGNNVVVRNNMLYNCSDQIIIINLPGGYDPFTNFTFENNLLYGGDLAGQGSKEFFCDAVDGLTMVNNTIIGDVLFRGRVTNLTLYNNILWRVDDDDGTNGTGETLLNADENYNIVGSWHVHINPNFVPGENSDEIGLFETFEELFADYDNHDYRLAADSAAIDAGIEIEGLTTDVLGVSRPQGDGFDIGAYEYVPSDSNGQYNLTISSTSGGSVTTPGEAGPYSYDYGTVVSIESTAASNYHFVNWTGTAVDAGKVANSNAASTTVTMDADYSIQANFAIDQHNLTAASTSGGSVTTPGEAGPYSYDHGINASIIATADLNYHFVNWTGTAVDADKVANSNAASTTVTMDANYSIQANFAIDQHYLTASSTSGGSVTTPGEAGPYSYDYGTVVSILATADANYYFVNWTGTAVNAGKVANSNAASTTITMDADYSIQANFAEQDKTAPSVTNRSPDANSIQVPLNNLVTFHIVDAGKGVDANLVTIKVNNNIVYTGNTTDYSSAYGHCRRTGTKADYTFIYQSDNTFDFDQTIIIAVNAIDLAGNAMSEYSYSFKTEMRSFGKNKKVNSGSDNLSKGGPVTVRDSAGNIWVAWHAGPAGSRDIYVGKLTAGADNFGNSVQLTDDATDQCNAAIAVDADDKLYVVWQDNRRGNWDIYVSTSVDGVNWSAEKRVNDSNDNEINPAIVVDGSLSNKAYIVWQDDRWGNQDIYVASSINDFATKTISQVTSDSSDQTEPAIAADSDDTIYIVWTDKRNGGKNDIYGAASNDGPWANVPIVSKEDSQSSPAIATEATGSILHLLWIDDTPGDDDIFYAKTTGGLPESSLSGSSIIDDDSGADQLEPVIAVTGSTDNNLVVFACWQDERNVSGSNADTDLYFVEVGSGNGTNVLVGDDGTNADQSEPAMGIDGDGYPYLVWADSRNANTDIYYAGSTFAKPDVLASEDVSASSGATVGTEPDFISGVDDVSIEVPAGAYSCDITITISKIENPPAFTMQCLGAYDFGPSGIEFSQPVTVTIPYNYTGSEDLALAYWYNSLTEALSQQGITDVETIEISPTLHALRFKTTHFTPFYIFLGSAGAVAGGGGGGGGGGGCSISRSSQANWVEFLLPYIGLAVAMIILKRRDARNRKARNTT